MSEAVEALREIWTPDKEVVEVSLDTTPQTELDSMIRHILHAVCQQHGSQEIDLGSQLHPVLNTGQLRIEKVVGPGPRAEVRRQQLTVWVVH